MKTTLILSDEELEALAETCRLAGVFVNSDIEQNGPSTVTDHWIARVGLAQSIIFPLAATLDNIDVF